SEQRDRLPDIEVYSEGPNHAVLRAIHHDLGERFLHIDDRGRREQPVDARAELLFTNNETNTMRLFGVPSRTPWVKDAFHECVVRGDRNAVNPARRGTKAAAWRRFVVPARGSVRWMLRFGPEPLDRPFANADALLAQRRSDADEFYAAVQGPGL